MGYEGRATVPASPVEGALLEAANAETAARHLGDRLGRAVGHREPDAVDAVAGSEFLDDRLDFA